ncbi:hypothetical protein F2Q69_00003768 [Brassica cretica]|uniref:Uncharacterized protein n=1 Tax=Brassica cretica TaxID=69181 RepID=A0A8S9NTP3_BRACR|nr:hypothetical protein F2Q69_00003768 [Brassica cretica]
MNQTLSMSLSLWWVVLSTSNMVSSPDNAAYRILGSSPEDFLTGVALSNSTVVEVVSSRRSSLSLINLFASEKAEYDEPSTPTWRVLSRGEKTLRSGLDLVTKAAHTSDVSELSQSRDWPDEPLIFLWWLSPVLEYHMKFLETFECIWSSKESDLAGATPRCRSRFHRSEARERPYSDVPQRHHKVAPAGSDVTGATQPGSSRRATRSDVSQRPLQVAPEAWSDLSERLLETYSLLKIVSKLKVDSLIDHLSSLVRNLITQGALKTPNISDTESSGYNSSSPQIWYELLNTKVV